MAEKDSFKRNQYVVGRISPHIMIGRLIEGEPDAHFSNGIGSTSFANMFMLISLV